MNFKCFFFVVVAYCVFIVKYTVETINLVIIINVNLRELLTLESGDLFLLHNHLLLFILYCVYFVLYVFLFLFD